MTGLVRPLMSVEGFFRWQSAQDGPYELVAGVPVPHEKLRYGVSAEHDLVTINIIAGLGAQLRGTDCRPTTGNLGFRTSATTLRRPDVTVECGEFERDTYENRTPRLVVEVLSPSTSSIDRFRKLDEYRRHPTLSYILLVETRFASAVLYRRQNDGWNAETFERLDDVIALPEIAASLALSDVYEGVVFEAGRSLPG